ncbi:hypothetical protein N1F89_19235 [Aquibium sp. A9E412]|uniref:hypothetical protein n=1 Tax=Aquibium sp. A9E412 TaxID=2976767 RepID=UPI0025B077BD|nr:hypothetical protein [Aquibium sp. A9E412]MDN2568364.1 hypothetical protein [Aquibium sp. A9E412]
MASGSRFREDLTDDLREQLDELRHDIARLRRDVSGRSARAYRGSRHMADEVAEALREYADAALPTLRRGARVARRQAHDHPGSTAAVALVGLAVLGLGASLFLRR